MKNLFLSALLTTLVAACVPNQSPVRLLLAHSLVDPPTGTGTTSTCDNANALFVSSGSFDISSTSTALATSAYLLRFDMENDLQQVTLTAPNNGIHTQGPENNDFVVDSIKLSYAVTPTGIALAPESIPAYFVLRAGTSNGSVIVNAFGPKAIQTLQRATQITATAPATVVVGVQLSGALASGQALGSNVANFPITVYRSGFDTAACARVAANGPCGRSGGQDGIPVLCCPAAGVDAGIPGC